VLIRMLILSAAGPLLLLAACSSSGDNATTTPKASQTTSASGAQPQAITVTAVDFSLSPVTITASAGQVINVSFKNNGSTQHSFTVGTADVALAAGGASSSGSFTAFAQTVEFHCKFHPTQMKGTITISGSNSNNTGATSTPAAAIGGGMGY
jgi:Cupredoxin-like domain